jgi:hypothetical protein
MMARCFSALFILLLCTGARATTLQDLLEADQLRLQSWLVPAEEIAVGQEVRLVIEVATRRWFAGGTRIRPPEIRNLVVLQRDQFATNLSRNEEGQTWVVQQWGLELYPQIEGGYQLPGIALELAVNDAKAGIVRGKLTTAPLDFSAAVPALLRSTERWLATPSLKVSQQIDRKLQGLKPGDAFTRVVTITANNVTAMMLPTPISTELPGLSAYEEVPALTNRSNRGEAIAERVDSITYVVEAAGSYHIPEQVFTWWDTTSGQVQTVSLEALDIDAGSVVSTAIPQQAESIEIDIQLRWLLLAGVLLLAWHLIRRPRRQNFTDRQLLQLAARELRRGSPRASLRHLYHWLNLGRPTAQWLTLRQAAQDGDDTTREEIDDLLASVYGASTSAPGKLHWRELLKHRKQRLQSAPATEIQLNPGNNAGARKASG